MVRRPNSKLASGTAPYAGRGRAEAGAQPGEPGGDLAGFGHPGAQLVAAVGAVAAQL